MHFRTGLTAGQVPQRGIFITTAILALPFFLASCKLENDILPSGPTGDDAVGGTGTIGSAATGAFAAPIISDPLPGSTVASSQPTLTVLNAAQSQRGQQALQPEPSTQTSGFARTYLFQVSSNAQFATLDAQSGQVPEGADGSTKWTIDRALPDGSYFWRVRARSGTNDSSFSSTAEFSVGGTPTAGTPPPSNPPSAPPPAPTPASGSILSDPLIGGSIGQVAGGQFSSSGWTVTSPGNFIRYEVPPLSSGWVEFDTRGLQESNPANNQFMLFGMWDPSAGPFRENPYRVNLQKLHPNPHNPPYLRMRWISNREQHDEGNLFYQWIPSRTYHWRIEWGGGQATVYLDGARVIHVNYNRTYRPNAHYIELGIGERGESIVGVTYSNFQVGN